MKSADDWLEEMFGRGNWVVADTITIKEIQRDAIKEAAEIVHARIVTLETWGDDETQENVHIKEIRALRPIYDAIIERGEKL